MELRFYIEPDYLDIYRKVANVERLPQKNETIVLIGKDLLRRSFYVVGVSQVIDENDYMWFEINLHRGVGPNYGKETL